jgi:small subunit ribosomal protein S9
VARVRLCLGEGNYLINGKKVDEYFPEERDRRSVLAPLNAVGNLGRLNVFVNVKGGGMTGQAGAVVLGVARALCSFDPQIEAQLRDGGYMTRDSRMVERKKYGQRGARRRFQFSKR